MTRKPVHIALCATMAGLIFSSYGSGPFAGGAGNHTGSASSPANCSFGSGCHPDNNSSVSVTVSLIDNGTPVTTYVPGKTYRVLLLGGTTGTSRPRFGFQVSAAKASNGATQAGTLNTGGAGNMAVRNSTPQLIEHTGPIAGTLAGSAYVDSISFNWTAPTAGFGRVRFYAVLNTVNFTGTSAGDLANAGTSEFEPVSVGINTPQQYSLSIYPNPATDILHIKGSGETDYNITIVDAIGKTVLGKQAKPGSGPEMTLDIHQLPPGTYFIAISAAAGLQYYSRFVKK